MDTLFTSLGSLIGALGIGAIIGAFFRSLFEYRRGIEKQQHELKFKRYACILILLLTRLDSKTGLRHIRELRPDLQDLGDVEKEIRVELLNSILFASDDVVRSMFEFIRTPSYSSYFTVAISMRRDLWGKKTSVTEQTLNILREESK